MHYSHAIHIVQIYDDHDREDDNANDRTCLGSRKESSHAGNFCRSTIVFFFFFHYSFPSRISDKERFDAWIRAVNRQTESGSLWLPSSDGHDKVCSEHFLKTDDTEGTKFKILKNTAVPSIFPGHPSHLQKPKQTPRPQPRKRRLVVYLPSLTVVQLPQRKFV